MKDKNGTTITKVVQETLDESGCNRNKICIDKGSEFYNRSMRSCLQGNDTEMSSTHNEGKSALAKKFIRTLNNKIHKYMTLVSKFCIVII